MEKIRTVHAKYPELLWQLLFDERLLLKNDEVGLSLTFSPDLVVDLNEGQ